MKVLKFGGSSVAKPERIRGIVDILKDYYASGDHFTVVFSAFGGVTDGLIEMSLLAAAGRRSLRGGFPNVRRTPPGRNCRATSRRRPKEGNRRPDA